MFVCATFVPRAYLRHRNWALAICRLYAFALPYASALPLFNATAAAPSSLPGLGWAVDAFMALFGRCLAPVLAAVLACLLGGWPWPWQLAPPGGTRLF